MAELNIETFQDYIESLCEQHSDVAHNAGGQRSFARLLSDEQIDAISNNAAPNVVIVSNYNGRATGQAHEAKMRQVAQIMFLSYARTQNTEGINAATATAFNVMMDFVSRFRKDQDDAGHCDPLKDFELQNISWDLLQEPMLQAHYGWELTLPFSSYQPEYNPDKWL
ncbi:MAG: hypothetical protein EOO14_02535 [Chitinophagaceae bacterium]|nr:MAG: hypothetical protein EOO14_02535 [Chitinophagaceae bacterium]